MYVTDQYAILRGGGGGVWDGVRRLPIIKRLFGAVMLATVLYSAKMCGIVCSHWEPLRLYKKSLLHPFSLVGCQGCVNFLPLRLCFLSCLVLSRR